MSRSLYTLSHISSYITRSPQQVTSHCSSYPTFAILPFADRCFHRFLFFCRYLRRVIQISFAIDLFLLSSFFFISHCVKRIIERDVRNFYGRRQKNRSIAYYQTISREKCFCNFSHDHYSLIILQDILLII